MVSSAALRRLSTLGLYLLALAATGVAGASVRRHMVTVRQFQASVLPAALSLPETERRIGILRQQMEAADLQRALVGGVLEERIRALVVPADVSHERLVGVTDAVLRILEDRGVLRERSALVIGTPGDPLPVQEGSARTVQMVPVTVRMRTAIDGPMQALALFSVASTPTVGDALDPRDLRLLLTLSEQENPAAVTSLEQFFDTDLLAYAREPRATVDALLKSFTSASFAAALDAALQAERIRQARGVLGGDLGKRLGDAGLWPPPALFPDRLVRTRQADGTVAVELTFLTPVRTEALPGA